MWLRTTRVCLPAAGSAATPATQLFAMSTLLRLTSTKTSALAVVSGTAHAALQAGDRDAVESHRRRRRCTTTPLTPPQRGRDRAVDVDVAQHDVLRGAVDDHSVGAEGQDRGACAGAVERDRLGDRDRAEAGAVERVDHAADRGLEIAPAHVLHGAVRLHGLTSSPTPDTQVRVACAKAGGAATAMNAEATTVRMLAVAVRRRAAMRMRRDRGRVRAAAVANQRTREPGPDRSAREQHDHFVVGRVREHVEHPRLDRPQRRHPRPGRRPRSPRCTTSR